MKKVLVAFLILAICFTTTASARKRKSASYKKAKSNYGARLGVGMDISGGIAYGLAGTYHIPVDKGTVGEIGLSLYGTNNSIDYTENSYNYTDKTQMLVFGLLVNYIANYVPNNPFFLAGVGLAGSNVTFKRSSTNDTSLGTLDGSGGSYYDVAGFAFGSVINFGLGFLFDGGFDLRLETPLLFLFSNYGRSATFVPTITLTGGYQF
ncbi:hypothetical protein ACFL52_00945 [Candidatus Margulisiibacteriota bacterium]